MTRAFYQFGVCCVVAIFAKAWLLWALSLGDATDAAATLLAILGAALLLLVFRIHEAWRVGPCLLCDNDAPWHPTSGLFIHERCWRRWCSAAPRQPGSEQ